VLVHHFECLVDCDDASGVYPPTARLVFCERNGRSPVVLLVAGHFEAGHYHHAPPPQQQQPQSGGDPLLADDPPGTPPSGAAPAAAATASTAAGVGWVNHAEMHMLSPAHVRGVGFLPHAASSSSSPSPPGAHPAAHPGGVLRLDVLAPSRPPAHPASAPGGSSAASTASSAAASAASSSWRSARPRGRNVVALGGGGTVICLSLSLAGGVSGNASPLTTLFNMTSIWLGTNLTMYTWADPRSWLNSSCVQLNLGIPMMRP
jgi:hypothetical protein